MAITLTQQDIKALLADPNITPEEKARLQQSVPQAGLLSSIGSGVRGVLGATGAALQPFGESLQRRAPQMARDILDTQRFYEMERMRQPTMVPISQLGQLRSVTPAGVAAGLDQYRAAEQSAIQKPLIEAADAEAGLLSARSKVGGLFGGTSMTAQAMNIIRSLGPLVKAGTASPQQIQDYKLAELSISKPRVQTYTDPTSGVVTQTEVPGMDVGRLGFPTFQEGVPLGSKEPKYNENETKGGTFAANMWNAERDLTLLEESRGYDPTSSKDYWARVAPMGVEGFFRTAEGQLYARAKEAFVNAALRRESGAAIRDDEFFRKEKELFGLPGETKEVVEAKRKARKVALEGMIKSSGKYYDRTFPGMTVDSIYKGREGSSRNPKKVFDEAEVLSLPAGTYYLLNGQLGLVKQ